MRHFKRSKFYALFTACWLTASASAWSAQVACTPVGSVPAGQAFAGRSFNKCYQMTYSGADQVVNIRANTYVSSKLWGAAGGTGIYSMRGGAGGYTEGAFVADGRPLTVVVGQGGGVKYDWNGGVMLPGLTGYGGGGKTKVEAFYDSSQWVFDNWGGGLAGIFYNGSPFAGGSYNNTRAGTSNPTSNAATIPVLVAGGGGAGSGSAWSTAGGSGGGLQGQNAIHAPTGEQTESKCSTANYRQAAGGAQSSGGVGGLGLALPYDVPDGEGGISTVPGDAPNNTSPPMLGDPGFKWWGGWGGLTGGFMPGGGDNGGGGAGYYGGGGGSPSWNCDDSGAAGGSGYVSPTLVVPGTGQFAMSPNVYTFGSFYPTWVPHTAPHSNDPHYIAGIALSGAPYDWYYKGQNSVKSGDALVVLQYYEPTAAPSLTIKKISNGGTGSFAFKGTANANGFSTDNSYTISTTAAGVAASGTTVPLGATNVLTEVQEASPSGWAVASASCVDANAAGTGNPTGSFGTLVGNTLQIPAANVRAYADLQCTFTNAKLTTTLTVRQMVLSPVPVNLNPPFTFSYTGNNGWSAAPLTNTSLNTVVSSAAVALTATNTATTVSTTLPEPRWFVSSFNCTDTNAAITGNPTGNLATSLTTSVTVPAANVRAGAALRCTLLMGHYTPRQTDSCN